MIRVRNITRETYLITRGRLADTFLSRLLGLMGRRSLAPGEGLVIVPSKGVHTWWMRFPIDVVYVDAAWRVIDIDEDLRPWRFGRIRGKAHAVIEVPAGTVASTRTRVGDVLALERVRSPQMYGEPPGDAEAP